MKWENRDITVVERANVPKFSKLDDVVTSPRLLETFFDHVLVDTIVGYTKLYSHRKKEDIGFENNNEKIRLFLRMLPLNRCHKLSDCKMYWETTPIIHLSVFFGAYIFKQRAT